MYRGIFQGHKWYVTKIVWNDEERDNIQSLVDEGTVVLYGDDLDEIERAIGDDYELVES